MRRGARAPRIRPRDGGSLAAAAGWRLAADAWTRRNSPRSRARPTRPRFPGRRRRSTCPGRGADRFPHSSRYDLEALEREKVRIREVRIECIEIFDPSIPGEDRTLYRWVNKLHIKTREETIRHQVLFAAGEPLVRTRLEETERNLRALPFIQDASVEVEDVGSDGATIKIRTSDVWSTRVNVRVSSAGGATTGGFAVSERNLLGFGKDLQLRWQQGVDRTTTRLIYGDPNLFGSRLNLALSHMQASDGKGDSVALGRPYRSFEDRISWFSSAVRNSEEVPIYREGEYVQSFSHDIRTLNGSVSWSRPLDSSSGAVERWSAGYLWDDTVYNPIGTLSPLLSDEELPESRTISGPVLTWSRVRREFLKTKNFERFSRWEDFNLGGSVTVRLQPSLSALGASDDEIIYGLDLAKGYRTWKGGVLLGTFALFGRAGAGEHAAAHLDLNHYYPGWRGQTLFVSVEADTGVNLAAQNRFQLGGDTGLRGFELRSFDGTHRFVIQVEDRIRFNRELLHFLRLGVAPFLDVGNAWGGTRSDEVCTTGASGKESCEYVVSYNSFGNLKADIGVSLLADVVKASSAGFLRLNIAWPLDGAKYNQGRFLLSFGHQGDF